MKTVEYNDIDLEKFQEYKHIQTGTVWNSDVNVYSQILDAIYFTFCCNRINNIFKCRFNR